MNPRERFLSVLLGGFIAVGVVGLAAYLLYFSPNADKADAIEKLKNDVGEKTDKKNAAVAGFKKFTALKAISLPPEPNTAQREYDYILTELLNRAGVPAGSRTVVVKLPTEKTTIPLINPGAIAKDKKYAYQKVTADITMSRVNLPSLMKFLTSYQNLSVLQHITKMSVKVQDSEAGGSLAGRGRGNSADRERKDLTVTLSTEAVILDGVHPRESLVRIPTPVAAVGGAAAYYALDTNPDVGRRLALMETNRPLPTPTAVRDYTTMAYKDPFHGRMPDPPPERGPYIAPPPPGIGQQIRLNGWSTHADGSVEADIHDYMNNATYKVKLTRKGEKLHTSVTKQRVVDGIVQPFSVIPGTDVKSWEDRPFTIADEASWVPSSTKRTFTVHGLVPYGLIVSSPAGDDEKAAAQPGFGGGRGGFGGGNRGGRGGFGAPGTGRTSLPKPTADAAVAGTAITVKPEKYYVWVMGQALSDLKEVPAGDVDALLRQALSPLMPEPPGGTPTSPVATTSGDGR
jgi:hypothetical protein